MSAWKEGQVFVSVCFHCFPCLGTNSAMVPTSNQGTMNDAKERWMPHDPMPKTWRRHSVWKTCKVRTDLSSTYCT